MNFILKILITAVNVFLLAMLLPGIELKKDDFITAIIVALVLAYLDTLEKVII